MKVLPIKLPDEMYEDLKAVSVRDGLSMAEILRNYVGTEVKKRAKKIKTRSSTPSLLDHIKKYSYAGIDHAKGLTDDEILYGGTLGDE